MRRRIDDRSLALDADHMNRKRRSRLGQLVVHKRHCQALAEAVAIGPRGYIADAPSVPPDRLVAGGDRKSTRLNSSHQIISYAVFCLKKKKKINHRSALSESFDPCTSDLD